MTDETPGVVGDTSQQDIANAVARAEGRADEGKATPDVQRALEKVERKVEETLATSTSAAPNTPLTKTQHWTVIFVVVGLLLAILLNLWFDIGGRASAHREMDKKIETLLDRHEYMCLKVLELLPDDRKTLSDIARCGVQEPQPR
jgi:hypothetical protein